jgi:hypothetical protein
VVYNDMKRERTLERHSSSALGQIVKAHTIRSTPVVVLPAGQIISIFNPAPVLLCCLTTAPVGHAVCNAMLAHDGVRAKY